MTTEELLTIEFTERELAIILDTLRKAGPTPYNSIQAFNKASDRIVERLQKLYKNEK